ncbi:hypothetical protein BT96DRAFT_723898 [Gymnopus androsaceus JB14]|uniref:Cyclin N-terminal domain-containing protein n=1 Tax=Gymnopus androsaceus JB14 TaxID=1447944 RepID=A0A6A4HKK2_9AGAR|nr:hypothetical protein BT96DRAFT_723898 [Gymnopus androsaceus JB14]
MRFFDIVFGTQEMRQKDKVKGLGLFSRSDIDGSELVTWDVAIACLALSVKLHRDFLAPLFQVYSFQFEELAPHYIEYEDLEAAQRDILFALSYNLGGTPQGILDELWIALPSLRELLSFNQGWSSVLQETWLILFEAVSDPEVMKFSLSLLTAAAVMEGLMSALVREYQSQDPWYETFRRRRLSAIPTHTEYDDSESQPSECGSSSFSSSSTTSSIHFTPSANYDTFTLQKAKERMRRTRIESEEVLLDIQAALGIADNELEVCREWITPFVGSRW